MDEPVYGRLSPIATWPAAALFFTVFLICAIGFQIRAEELGPTNKLPPTSLLLSSIIVILRSHAGFSFFNAWVEGLHRLSRSFCHSVERKNYRKRNGNVVRQFTP